ncbi:ATP-grasp fold amidoligase family protein [Tenacibaculum bernardetii]|uniref:ATP-grasp fold amidoligase family protein n=1 Tax=Tenacibaculum bernardetii TaxID=3021375 RepID=UPI0023AF66B1|nr:ATP-grasp fold amidoligase family protein [Tenacibaculum bernardetii]
MQGYRLDLNNVKTLNEKIQWLKLYDRTPLHTICADKVLVRDYVEEKLGSKYLIPIVNTFRYSNEITPEKLPNYPVIIKTNHDSGSYFIIKDKINQNWIFIKEKLSQSLNNNYYYSGREWQYKNIKPLIIIEKLLIDSDGKIPMDYKLHCFSGKVEYISVDIGRGTDNHCRNWYDKNWNRAPFKWSSISGSNKTDPSKKDVEKPTVLNEMIKCSEVLAKDFAYVRVDWYDLDSKLFFGEITFHHDSGFLPIEPYNWDLKLGNLVDLSNIKR